MDAFEIGECAQNKLTAWTWTTRVCRAIVSSKKQSNSSHAKTFRQEQ